ncbi:MULTISPECIES: DNA translocase FtsK [unclassified Treponema]|uniref:DNA translocase FtsK n=1 Tax=unclassified Treponema TaxID=2638727 RepID=UPI0020A49FDF|nr:MULTISPECIES: DNA translocase FtsK [unclassified Treponema]UTC66785.1 DNA translocase FtsK [Treponema sp. OMZ 789]UTC69518.1 DNA translocase FtsK [Treponema sp. OMZ 790]UTC72232.1 DNA translocase FtsK [Treponema sp. OMZ 791]
MIEESKFRIISILLGILIFICSIYIALAVLLPIFGFKGYIFPFEKIGTILFSTYRFSSLLIPIILLYSSILLMIPGWSLHSKFLLSFMPVYFLTCVLGEHLIYFLLPKIINETVQEFTKITITLSTALLLVIEVFLTLMLTERLNKKAYLPPQEEEIEDIIGDSYPSPETAAVFGERSEADKTGFWLKSNTTKFAPDTNRQRLSSAMLTRNQFIKPQFDSTAEEVKEEAPPLENVDADIKIDIGDSPSSEAKKSIIDSLVVIEDISIEQDLEELGSIDEGEKDLSNSNTQELPEPKIEEPDYFEEDNDISEAEEDDDDDDEDDLQPEETEDEDADILFSDELSDDIEISAAQPLKPKADTRDKKKGYHIPYDLLTKYPGNEYWIVDDSTRKAAVALKNTFEEFNISIEITGIRKGPVVTMFEVLPPPGIKLGKITALQDNIALRLAAQSVRIVAPIPGKQAVGIEVPNESRAIVGFRELIETQIPETEKMGIPIVLGKDVTGEPQTLDLCQTPHLLIAGATGSGKSVCVNSIILSILYNKSPEEVKLLLVDPKIVELKLYNGIGHLLTPVITEPKKALQGLQYCICEMERRYAMLDSMSVRDIKSYNKKIKREKIAAEPLPYIVIIIDEFADLMATTGKELEATVSRLCAMSRAVGIHLVLATQRPSTNVITGLIKANIPSRIAFMVASRVDSQIILDNIGAEKLLGKGDMLYVSTTKPFPARIQGTFVSDDEVEQVVECVKTFGEPDYIDDEIFVDDEEYSQGSLFGEESDPLYDEALEIVLAEGKASASYIQRRLKIGYNRAARIVEEMEERGVVGPANGSKPREVITHS